MASALTLKQYDTFPTWKAVLSDSSGAVGIDLTNAASVKWVGKGNNTSTAQGGTATITQTNGTCTMNSTATLTSFSATFGSSANIIAGMTVTGTNIPAGTTVVSYNSGTMVMSQAATGSGSSLPIIVGMGSIAYTPVTPADTGTVDIYATEVSIHWTTPSGAVQKVPNSSGANPSIEVDGDLGGSGE